MTNTIPNVPRELKPCPFCGGTPELPNGDGTQYEIECGGCGQAKAGVQICDLMTLEERVADAFTDYRYGEEFVERAKVQAIEHWNNRAPSPAGVDADHVDDVRAMVADPSPAGVDGLEVVGYLTTYALEVDMQQPDDEPLVRLSDAQAIIDGLRGEVEELKHAASGELLSRLCQQLIDSGAENYHGSVFDLELGSELLTATVTLQYRGKPNAHDLRIAAETERDQQAQRIGELEGLLRHAQKQVPTGSGLHMRIDAALSAVCAAAPNIATTSEHNGS